MSNFVTCGYRCSVWSSLLIRLNKRPTCRPFSILVIAYSGLIYNYSILDSVLSASVDWQKNYELTLMHNT